MFLSGGSRMVPKHKYALQRTQSNNKVFVLDVDTLTWSKPNVAGSVPLPRYRHAVAATLSPPRPPGLPAIPTGPPRSLCGRLTRRSLTLAPAPCHCSCKPGDFGVFITMGPGAGIECALWRA